MHDFFNKHPASVGESYWQHMGVAFSFAFSLFGAAFAVLIHAFFPALCEKTGSRKINELHSRMVMSRCRKPQDENASFDAPFEAKVAEGTHQY